MNENRISAGGQIRIYAGKCFRLFWSEKQWKKLISTLIIMGIISLVTGDKMFKEYPATKNGAFAVICACIWVGLFNSIQSICRERAIIKREHRTGLRLPSYVMAHVLYELALCAIEAVIVLTIVFLRNADHLPDSGIIGPRVVDMYISFLLIIFASDLIAMLVSCIVKNENEAMTVMPFVLIVQLVMSGAVFELSGVTELISNSPSAAGGSMPSAPSPARPLRYPAARCLPVRAAGKMSRTICSSAGCCCSPSARRIHFWRCWRSRA